MEQGRVRERHGVLVAAEPGQRLVEEPGELPAGVISRQGQLQEQVDGVAAHGGEAAGVDGGEQVGHVVVEAGRFGDRHGVVPRPAVLGVEVPAPAGGLVAVHEDAVLAAQVAVERLLEPALLAGEERRHVVAAGVEVVGRLDAPRNLEGVGGLTEGPVEAPVVGLEPGDGIGTQLVRGGHDVVAELAPVLAVVDPPVDHPVALLLQGGGEGPHGAQEGGGLLPVVPGDGELTLGLDHEVGDVVIDRREPRVTEVELVAEDQPEFAACGQLVERARGRDRGHGQSSRRRGRCRAIRP